MSLASKILIGFIMVGAIVLAFLSARVLAIHTKYRKDLAGLETQIETQRETNARLRSGGGANSTEPSIRSLREALANRLLSRGKAWFDAALGELRPDGQLGVGFPAPGAVPPAENTVVYVFDARPVAQGAGYLGEFKVGASGPQGVLLQPTRPLLPLELEKLASLQGVSPQQPLPIRLYDQIPADRRDLFRDLPPEESEAALQLLPPALAELYRLDGQEAPAELRARVPAEQIVEGIFTRALNDYLVLANAGAARIEGLAAQLEAARTDLQLTESTLTGLREQVTRQDARLRELQAEVTESTRERDLAKRVRDQFQTKVQELDAAVAELLADNRRLSQAWGDLQLRLLEAADASPAVPAGPDGI